MCQMCQMCQMCVFGRGGDGSDDGGTFHIPGCKLPGGFGLGSQLCRRRGKGVARV